MLQKNERRRVFWEAGEAGRLGVCREGAQDSGVMSLRLGAVRLCPRGNRWRVCPRSRALVLGLLVETLFSGIFFESMPNVGVR